ncbi:hypothetical protein HDU98_009229 [Podochytrium sp. JEL0797]|nr:hypothetical protein HDU98_009229 [Podochytrium sp. JEL0797]
MARAMLAATPLRGPTLTLIPLDLSNPASPETTTLFTSLLSAANSNPTIDLFQHMTLGPFTTPTGLRDHYIHLTSTTDALVYILHRNSDNAPMGSFSFLHGSEDNKRVEIGAVWIGPEFHGKGYALEATYLLLQHAFSVPGKIQRVEWSAHHENVASQKAAVKIGFVFEGVLRKHRFYKGRVRNSFMYSIVEDEWEEKKQRLEGMMMKS